MGTFDDPILALILRFVGHNQDVSFSNQDFVQKQLEAIKEYVQKFPAEEQDSRAVEWIGKYARDYRKSWERDVLGNTFFSHRCPDCPLSENGQIEHCQIHERWLELLQQYAADEINSTRYVESTLRLLAQHKEDLKIKRSMFEELE